MSDAGHNWAGNIHYAATALHSPRTVEHLQELVSTAQHVRALGSRHSFNDIADSPGVLVSLADLEGDVVIDPVAHSVTFPAGLRYGELALRLENAGWALANLASLPHISVAGAVATGTHGSGDKNPTLSAAVSALSLVIADGTILHLNRDDPEFAGCVVGIGALGIITSLTLDIEPTFSMRQDLYGGVTIDDVIESFDEVSAAGYSVSVNPDWISASGGRIRVKSRATGAPDSVLGAHRISDEDVVPEGVTDRTGLPGPWLDRLPHFMLGFTPSFGDELQSEYLLEREHAGAAIDALRALAPEFTPAMHSAELRTMCADDLWLSPAYGRDTVGIHFTWKLDASRVLPLLPRIERALAPFDPRPHWGKLFAGARGTYPRMNDFLELRARLDPNGVFANAYSDRVLPRL